MAQADRPAHGGGRQLAHLRHAPTDAHNGLRVLRRDVLAQLDLRQNRMAHASEIIRQIGATGMPWREFPVHIVYTDYSRAKGQSLWNSVNILVDLLFS